MKKYEVLKAVVILQAVCMIALTGMVMVKVWPSLGIRGNEQEEKPESPLDRGSEDSKPGGERTIAIVGGKPITESQLVAELYNQYGDAVLRAMMVRQAIQLEAEASELHISQDELDSELAKSADGYDSEEQYFAVMEEQLGLSKKQLLEEIRYRLLMEKITIRDIAITDGEVERYIEEHAERFAPKQKLHLQWIVTDTRQQANDILKKLADGEEFAELAKAYSKDEFTANSGGDLGMIDADDPFYDESMLATALDMSIAEIAGPVELGEGFAILELIGRESTSALTGQRLLDTARKQLAMERAKPQTELEDELLERYEAAIVK